MRGLIALALVALLFVCSDAFLKSQLSAPRQRAALSLRMASAGAARKKGIVLGGDGFCGWPTSLYLSDQGHEVIVVDNLSRRKIDVELGCDSLTPIAGIEERVRVWNGVSGKKNLHFKYLDLQTDYAELVQLFKDDKPDTVVHFAEQRAAPYSMKDARRKRYTIDNNVSGTHNLMAAIVESGQDVHVVHLGTMGVYGYGTSGGEIPEGYLDVVLPGNISTSHFFLYSKHNLILGRDCFSSQDVWLVYLATLGSRFRLWADRVNRKPS